MSVKQFRRRRLTAGIFIFLLAAFFVVTNNAMWRINEPIDERKEDNGVSARAALNQLEVKGRAPKSGYERTQFGDGWKTVEGCDTRNIILNRDLEKTAIDTDCRVISGILHDPYTGKIITYKRGPESSKDVQIDHVVALSDAWQKGAQQLNREKRSELANDPLELLAVDGPSNVVKGDSDAATWLPPNKYFRCEYIARQIAVKLKYKLWITPAEKSAMDQVLLGCPRQTLPRP